MKGHLVNDHGHTQELASAILNKRTCGLCLPACFEPVVGQDDSISWRDRVALNP